jgi:hypothetical protein
MTIAARYEDFAVQVLGEDEMAIVRRSLAKIYENLGQLESPVSLSPPSRRAPRAQTPRLRVR